MTDASESKTLAKPAKPVKMRWRVEHDAIVKAALKRTLKADEPVDWKAAAAYVSGRIHRTVSGGQVRERYKQHISPMVNKDEWTDGEVSLILRMWTQGLGVKGITAMLQPDAAGRRRSDLKVKNLIFGISRSKPKYEKLATQQLLPAPVQDANIAEPPSCPTPLVHMTRQALAARLKYDDVLINTSKHHSPSSCWHEDMLEALAYFVNDEWHL